MFMFSHKIHIKCLLDVPLGKKKLKFALSTHPLVNITLETIGTQKENKSRAIFQLSFNYFGETVAFNPDFYCALYTCFSRPLWALQLSKHDSE